MKNLKRLLFWYWALNKRLLKKPSFLIILLLIPLFTLFVSQAAEKGSGFVEIAVVALDKEDALAADIISEIKEGNRIAVVRECDTEEEAKALLEKGEIDTAWVILDNLKERAARLADGQKEKFARVYFAEDNTFVRASREKLMGELFPIISYEIYQNAALKLPLSPEDASGESLLEIYNSYREGESLIEYGYADSSQALPDGSDYITAPLKGLLCAVILLCGLAAALYFNSDDREGTFCNLTAGRRAAVYYFNNLAAVSMAGLFVSVAFMLSGIYTSFWRESLMMLLYIFASAGFCMLLGSCLKTPSRLSVAMPIVLILSVALSPVFFNLKVIPALQSLLPIYSYLYGVNDLRLAWGLLLLGIAYAAAAFYIYVYKNKGYIRK